MTELRTCRLCRFHGAEQVYVGGVYRLVKYNVRHYAHPVCLARKHGSIAAREMIPEHQRGSFDARLADQPADSWDRAMWETMDTMRVRREERATRAGKP